MRPGEPQNIYFLINDVATSPIRTTKKKEEKKTEKERKSKRRRGEREALSLGRGAFYFGRNSCEDLMDLVKCSYLQYTEGPQSLAAGEML